MAKDVLCSVNSCSYWAENNNCTASSIFITSKNISNKASESAETDCETFKVK